MTIEMGVIDRPVETQIIKNVSEIETQIMDNPKIKRIEDIIAPSYQFSEPLEILNKYNNPLKEMDQFIRIEITFHNYNYMKSKYNYWNEYCREKYTERQMCPGAPGWYKLTCSAWGVTRLKSNTLKQLCEDFGLKVDIPLSSYYSYSLYNPKYQTRLPSYTILLFCDSKCVSNFILEHVKRNLDEYDRLIKRYKMEIELEKELNELKEKMIDCLELTIQEIKEKKINELKQI